MVLRLQYLIPLLACFRMDCDPHLNIHFCLVVIVYLPVLVLFFSANQGSLMAYTNKSEHVFEPTLESTQTSNSNTKDGANTDSS